jgi:outer membrane lipase/esterase
MNPLSLIRRVRWPLAVLAPLAWLLASCGGGSTQVDPFVPDRLIAFGDELSAIEPDAETGHNGRSYSISGLADTDGVATTLERSCAVRPNWVQGLAAAYGFVFDACNPTGLVVNAVNHATNAAKAVGSSAADLDAQIAAQAALGFTSRDLVTMLVGQNDVFDLYEQMRAGLSEAAALAEAESRGKHVAGKVDEIIAQGPRVLVVTVPELGYSPFGRDLTTDADRTRLLVALTAAFNQGLRTGGVQDGHFVGFVVLDDLVARMTESPSSYGALTAADVSVAACKTTVALPNCTDADLAVGADGVTPLVSSADQAMWADAKRIGPLVHANLASNALSRATTNPF